MSLITYWWLESIVWSWLMRWSAWISSLSSLQFLHTYSNKNESLQSRDGVMREFGHVLVIGVDCVVVIDVVEIAPGKVIVVP